MDDKIYIAMERKIGEIFEYGGEWYQCLNGECTNCDLFIRTGCFSPLNTSCSKRVRKDKQNVIFKKLEKVGEPMEFARGLYFQRYLLAYSTAFYEGDTRLFFNAPTKTFVYIELKQNKEDMEEKKIQLSQEDMNWLKKEIRWSVLPGYSITYEEDYDRIVEEVMKLFSIDTKHSNSESIGKNLRPFDLEAAKSGKPVCTRDGRKARIICWDRIDSTGCNLPIVALVQCEETEVLQLYHDNGKCDVKADLDLMMLPEKKEGWVNVYKKEQNRYVKGIFPSREIALNSISEKSREYIATIKITWEE